MINDDEMQIKTKIQDTSTGPPEWIKWNKRQKTSVVIDVKCNSNTWQMGLQIRTAVLGNSTKAYTDQAASL